ncbi:MAG TPA: hypothetical protein V6C95_15350 [Coleofasciculaceae cyanobacterium]
MHLPPLPLSSNSQTYVNGDVKIDPSAAIAAGVILRANPDSQIIIAAGVCIGMGSILHAYQGTLEVEAGANLGAGVLVVGQGKIGANACIGATTTIWNDSVAPGQVVPPGSLLGNKGRQIPDEKPSSTPTSEPDSLDLSSTSTHLAGDEPLNGQTLSTTEEISADTTEKNAPSELPVEQPTSEAETTVYGQGNLNRLLKTLFPYNQSLNRPPEDG